MRTFQSLYVLMATGAALGAQIQPAAAATKAPSVSAVSQPDTTSAIDNCELNVQYPHWAKHGTGPSVNAQSTLTCDYPVSEINVSVELYFNGKYKSGGGDAAYNTSFLAANASRDDCVEGDWKNYSTASIETPDGPLDTSGYSTAYVNCPPSSPTVASPAQ